MRQQDWHVTALKVPNAYGFQPGVGVARNCTHLRTCRRPAIPTAYNFNMKGLISLLIVAAIGMGFYMYTLKQAAPGQGMVATQAIGLTGVQMDLTSIAQAERMYYAQNGSYADLATLSSSGTMNITRTSRDGYTYSVQPSANTFTPTTPHPAPPVQILK